MRENKEGGLGLMSPMIDLGWTEKLGASTKSI